MRVTTVVGSFALIVAVVVIAVQQSELTGLRAQIRATRDAAEVQPADQSRTPKSSTTIISDSEQSDLLRLRNEVTQLRAEHQRLKQLETENKLLREQAVVLQAHPKLLEVNRVTGSGSQSPTLDPLPPRTSYIGVAFASTSENAINIVSIAENSPAAQADLRVDDTILSVDGVSVTNLVQVRNALATRVPGYAVYLRILRQGVAHQVPVTPQSPPPDLQKMDGAVPSQ